MCFWKMFTLYLSKIVEFDWFTHFWRKVLSWGFTHFFCRFVWPEKRNLQTFFGFCTYGQVHSNVTQPSRPASDKIAKWSLAINIGEHRLCVNKYRFVPDHAHIWPKPYILWKLLFSLFPNFIHITVIFILSLCKVHVSVFMSNQLFVQTVVGPGPAVPKSADSLIPAAAPTHPLRDTFWKLSKCLVWRTWVRCQRAGPSNGTVSATPEDRE